MDPIHIPNEEEIRRAAREGEDAVVTMVNNLIQIIAGLAERVKTLEDQIAKNSGNSSKPPSSDGLQKKPKSLRHKSGNKSGGQAGHSGHRLQPVAHPDHIQVHPVSQCQHCQSRLETVPADFTKRQVFDLPATIRLEVTEHQAEIKTCPICGAINEANFPSEVTQETQYGPRVRTQMVYFNQYQFIPLSRTAEVIEDLYQQPLAEGSVVAANEHVAEQVAVPNQKVKTYLTDTPDAVSFDETGARVEGRLQWLHSASTHLVTYYEIHAKRGTAAMEAIGILPKRTGWSIHDYWKAYLKYEQAKHGLCNAHLIRDLIFVTEQMRQPWAGEMLDLLLKIKQAVETAQNQGLIRLSPEQVTRFKRDYERLVAEGLLANPPPERTAGKRGRVKQSFAKNLVDRLRDHPKKVLAFMDDFKVPFDNNLAERDIRMVKVQQKVSGGFRSTTGAMVFCQVRSYISTARKNGQPVLEAIYQAMIGTPFVPPFIASQVAE
jgi:transposase